MLNSKGSIHIETDRLYLRPVYVTDAKEVFETWASNDEVSRFMRWNTHENIDMTTEWLKDCEEQISNPNYYHWGIVIKDNNKLIGTIGAFKNSDEPDYYEPGYCLGQDYWGNGYATEALKGIMDYLINQVGIKKYICLHAIDNPASGEVMKKSGFKYNKKGIYKSFDGKRSFESLVYYLEIV